MGYFLQTLQDRSLRQVLFLCRRNGHNHGHSVFLFNGSQTELLQRGQGAKDFAGVLCAQTGEQGLQILGVAAAVLYLAVNGNGIGTGGAQDVALGGGQRGAAAQRIKQRALLGGSQESFRYPRKCLCRNKRHEAI